MMDQHEDQKFEQWLQGLAKSYHSPLPTPREEMWARIERARRERKVIELRPRPWLRWAIAAAAVLVVGISIGRWSVNQKSPRGAAPVVAMDTARQDAAYQVAAQQYLSRTEVLLTDFRAQSTHGRLDPQFVASARDLLTTTRLMLDSPAAARDPRLQPLLEDLELVLAQITQLSVEPGRKTEMDFINQGMNQRSVLTRLRTATPAVPGTVSVRAEGAL